MAKSILDNEALSRNPIFGVPLYTSPSAFLVISSPSLSLSLFETLSINMNFQFYWMKNCVITLQLTAYIYIYTHTSLKLSKKHLPKLIKDLKTNKLKTESKTGFGGLSFHVQNMWIQDLISMLQVLLWHTTLNCRNWRSENINKLLSVHQIVESSNLSSR